MQGNDTSTQPADVNTLARDRERVERAGRYQRQSEIVAADAPCTSSLRRDSRSPIDFFRAPPVTTEPAFKRASLSCYKALTLSFIILTMGRALPQSIATFAAVNVPLISAQRDLLSTRSAWMPSVGRCRPN